MGKTRVTGVYRFHDADSRHRQNRTVRYFEIYVSCNYGNSSELSLILIILVEVGCSSLVLLGFMTRLAVLPLMFSMIIAAFFTFSPISLSTAELPMLYLGIYTFILLAGPGRYSADAFFVKTFHLETSSESMEEV